MSKIGWSVIQVAESNFRKITPSDLQTDILDLMNKLREYGVYCQENHAGFFPSELEFSERLVPAIDRFAEEIKRK